MKVVNVDGNQLHRILNSFQLEYIFAEYIVMEVTMNHENNLTNNEDNINMHKEVNSSSPIWAKDAIIYYIVPEMFASSKCQLDCITKDDNEDGTVKDKQYQGSIQGITDNVDYLLKLGVNCICLNPFLVKSEKDNAIIPDYFQVNPKLGTNEEFKFMIDLCHNCNIKVLIEGQFQQGDYKNGKSQELLEKELSQENQINENDLMPDYYLELCRQWLLDYSIDGFLLYDINKEDADSMRLFCSEAKTVQPECFLIAEVTESNRDIFDECEIDRIYNNDFRTLCKSFYAKRELDAFDFDAGLKRNKELSSKLSASGSLNMLSNRLLPRFISECEDEVRRYQLAVLFLMTSAGIPMVWYGEEQPSAEHQEYLEFCPKRWEEENDLYAFFKATTFIRRRLKALREGKQRTIKAQKGSSFYAFERYTEEDCITIALNASSEEVTFEYNPEEKMLIWQSGLEGKRLSEYGFVILRQMMV